MPFLTLNGTTVPVKSNALGQKYNEHRLDRDRMFDGTMRVIRQGVYRQFDVTTALLSDSDADAILALVNGNAIPLALDGDIVENLPISVIPVPGASTPVQFSGGFKRQLTFTLHETPVALPPDTSASVEAFWRGGFGYKKTAWAGVTAADLEALPDAGDGDAVSGWLDQTGNQRHWMGGVDNFSTNSHSDAKSPTRDGTSLRFAAASATNMRILQTAGMTTWWNGHVQIEVMLAFQVTDPAPSVDGKNAVWTIAARDVTAYPSSTGHLVDGPLINGTAEDMGPVPAGVDLSSLTVVNFAIDVAAASPNFTAYLNNSLLFSNTLGGSYPSFGGSLSVVFLGIDGGLTGGGRYLDGKIKHCAFFSGPLTPSQRRSWFDFMRGALTDPPLP